MSEVSFADNTEFAIEVEETVCDNNPINSPLSNSRSRAKLEKAKMLDEEVQVAEKTAVVRRESRIVAEQVVGGVFSQMVVGALSSSYSRIKLTATPPTGERERQTGKSVSIRGRTYKEDVDGGKES